VTQTPNIYGEQIRDQIPMHGNNAVLTIDRDIQEAAFKSFMSLNRIGAVVAMRTNGEILAWVSTPSFDPNEFSTGISGATWSKLINDPFKPLRNKVIQDHNAPGSTMKPMVAVAALQEKVITPTTIVNAPGVFFFGRRPYHDSLKGGHGNITIYEALERSSNVFFYKMGIALGVDKMYDYIHLLGIGQKTGIELSREVSGTMPNSAWKKATVGEEWQPGENLSTAIGQGFVNVTPLSMAVAYNAIGTEGKVVRPFLVRKVIDQDGKVLRENFPQVVRDLQQPQSNGVQISENTFKVVKEGMRRVFNGERGTAKAHKVPGVEIAGKTGTAQVMGFSADQIYVKCEGRPIHMRHHGWLVAFAPAVNPEITIAALAEHSCHGGSGAGPVVKEIVLAYFQKYHPEILENALKAKAVGRKAAPAAPTQEVEGE
jgi:penicillin-binding protein 2